MSAQNTVRERTSLAWQRTALTLLGGTAGVVKMTHGTLGPVGLAGGAVVLALVAWVLWSGRKPIRRNLEVAEDSAARWGAALALGLIVVASLELANIVLG